MDRRLDPYLEWFDNFLSEWRSCYGPEVPAPIFEVWQSRPREFWQSQMAQAWTQRNAYPTMRRSRGNTSPYSQSLPPAVPGAAMYQPVPSAASTSSVRFPAPGQSVGSYSQPYPQSSSLSPSSTYRPVGPSAASTSSVRSPAPGQSVGSYSQHYPQSPSLSPSSTYRPAGPSAASTSSVRSSASGQSEGSYSQPYSPSPSLSPSSSRSSKSFSCRICFAELGTKQSLDAHILAQHEQHRLICPKMCGTTFSYSQALQRHLREGRCPRHPRAPPN